MSLTNNKQLILEIAELGLQGDKKNLLQILHNLAAEEISKKHHTNYNLILDLVDKYISKEVNSTQSSRFENSDTHYSLDFNVDDIWVPDNLKNKIHKFVRIHKEKSLSNFGTTHLNKLLLYGPPGSGKTTLGFYIAQQLDMSVTYAKVSDMISSRLGETMKNMAELFKSTSDKVIFIDEFDAFGKRRTDSNDVGELKRIVSSMIQTFDFYASDKIVIVSTNLIDSLDPAILRRFGFKVHVDSLSSEQIVEFFNFLCEKEDRLEVKLTKNERANIENIFNLIGLSTVDEIRLFFDKAVIGSVLDSRKQVTFDDFISTLFEEDYISHKNVRTLKKKDGETVSFLCKYLEDKKYPKTFIADLMGIHRNSYKSYAKKV